MHVTLRAALDRILRPLVRFLISRNVAFPEVSDRLKEVFVFVTEADFHLEKKRLTDSRISLLTGLQRRDIKAIRAQLDARDDDVDQGGGPLPQVIARWRASSEYQTGSGDPLPLPGTSSGGAPSFDALVAEVSRDIHSRTILDELLRTGQVRRRDGLLHLTAEAFVPRDNETALLGYFGANLGDHAEAAVGNVLASPDAGPFFERAVHYNQLSDRSLDELEDLARTLQGGVLAQLSAKAMELQKNDRGLANRTGRFRCGAYIYRCDEKTMMETGP